MHIIIKRLLLDLKKKFNEILVIFLRDQWYKIYINEIKNEFLEHLYYIMIIQKMILKFIKIKIF